MEKRLTRRQQQFLLQFLDLYREMNQPIHYRFVADRLKIGKVSVYEMLRLLEFNGFVKAEFAVTTGKQGPGRPSIQFYPTKLAFEQTQRLSVVPVELEQWHIRKEYILAELRNKTGENYENLVKDLVNSFTEKASPLLHVTENITLLLIIVSSQPMTPQLQSLMERLANIGLSGQIGLSTLFGFALGMAIFGHIDPMMANELLDNLDRYEFYLQDMHAENHQRLCDFTRDAVSIIFDL